MAAVMTAAGSPTTAFAGDGYGTNGNPRETAAACPARLLSPWQTAPCRLLRRPGSPLGRFRGVLATGRRCCLRPPPTFPRRRFRMSDAGAGNRLVGRGHDQRRIPADTPDAESRSAEHSVERHRLVETPPRARARDRTGRSRSDDDPRYARGPRQPDTRGSDHEVWQPGRAHAREDQEGARDRAADGAERDHGDTPERREGGRRPRRRRRASDDRERRSRVDAGGRPPGRGRAQDDIGLPHGDAYPVALRARSPRVGAAGVREGAGRDHQPDAGGMPGAKVERRRRSGRGLRDHQRSGGITRRERQEARPDRRDDTDGKRNR